MHGTLIVAVIIGGNLLALAIMLSTAFVVLR